MAYAKAAHDGIRYGPSGTSSTSKYDRWPGKHDGAAYGRRVASLFTRDEGAGSCARRDTAFGNATYSTERDPWTTERCVRPSTISWKCYYPFYNNLDDDEVPLTGGRISSAELRRCAPPLRNTGTHGRRSFSVNRSRLGSGRGLGHESVSIVNAPSPRRCGRSDEGRRRHVQRVARLRKPRRRDVTLRPMGGSASVRSTCSPRRATIYELLAIRLPGMTPFRRACVSAPSALVTPGQCVLVVTSTSPSVRAYAPRSATATRSCSSTL